MKSDPWAPITEHQFADSVRRLKGRYADVLRAVRLMNRRDALPLVLVGPVTAAALMAQGVGDTGPCHMYH